MKTVHIGIAKWLLLELLAKHGAAEVARDWKGTDEQLAAAIRADHREYFVLDSSCDKQGPDGACLGHEAEGRP